MKTHQVLSRVAGCSLIIVFEFNLYIGFYDVTLSQMNQPHHSLNWLISAICLITGVILLITPSRIFSVLAGILWPAIYLSSIFLDVETKLCFGTNFNCWPSVTDAYDYLILGSSVEGWVIWPYTMRVVIILLLLAVILSAASLAWQFYEQKPKDASLGK